MINVFVASLNPGYSVKIKWNCNISHIKINTVLKDVLLKVSGMNDQRINFNSFSPAVKQAILPFIKNVQQFSNNFWKLSFIWQFVCCAGTIKASIIWFNSSISKNQFSSAL